MRTGRGQKINAVVSTRSKEHEESGGGGGGGGEKKEIAMKEECECKRLTEACSVGCIWKLFFTIS